jgi:hypothetical protein
MPAGAGPLDGTVSVQFQDPAGTNVAGTHVQISGNAFQPGSTVAVYVHSTPQELGTAPVGPDGTFRLAVVLPPGLETGAHHIVVSGTRQTGSSTAQALPFTVALGGLLGAVGVIPPGPLAQDVPYDASSHPHAVLSTTAAAAATIGAVGAGLAGGAGGGGSRSGGEGGDSQSGGGYLEDVELERASFQAKGGGRYRTWRWPGTPHLDRHSANLPARAAAISPVAGRVLVDGDYLRAMFGGLWLFLCPAALLLGIFAARSTGWYALPPALPLFLIILGLGIMDATLGYLAGIGFFTSALLAGHLVSGTEIRVAAGVVLIWFAVPLAAAALRPLRRRLSLRPDVIWDRAADLVIGGLFAAWAAQKMVEALSGLAGVELPIGEHTTAIAYGVIAFIAGRMALETLAAHWYPGRLEQVSHQGELESGNVQVGLSLIIQISLFMFISLPYVHWSWALWIGTAVFFSPLIPWLWADRIPKSKFVTKWKPRRLTNWSLIIIFGALLSQVLQRLIHSDQLLTQIGFIVLTMPVLASWALELFEEEEEEGEEAGVGEEAEELELVAAGRGHVEGGLDRWSAGSDAGHDRSEEAGIDRARSARRGWALRLAGVPLLGLSIYLVTAGLVGG